MIKKHYFGFFLFFLLFYSFSLNSYHFDENIIYKAFGSDGDKKFFKEKLFVDDGVKRGKDFVSSSNLLNKSRKIGVIVPAYFYNNSEWEKLINQSFYNDFVVIINPSNGVGSSYVPEWDSYRWALYKNAKVIGYIYTSYGNRPLSEILNEAQLYIDWYDVDGFFLDEVNSSMNSYYSSLVDELRSIKGDAYIVANPGWIVEDNFASMFNLTVVFEDECSLYMNTELPNYTSNVAVLCYNYSGEDVVGKAIAEGVDFIYITEDVLPNPWDSFSVINPLYEGKRLPNYSMAVARDGYKEIVKDGKFITLRGINWFGFETRDYVVHGLWARNWKDMLNHMKRLGFNAIRLPFCSYSVMPNATPSSINFYLNRDLENDSSLAIMHKIVNYAESLGIYVLLDYHRIGCDYIEELWYTDGFSEEDYKNVWKWVALNFRSYSNVVGADLKNEPHGAARWGTGNFDVDWNLAAERIGKVVLSVSPNWLVFVEGTQFSNDVDDSEALYGYNNFWGENLQAVDRFPINLSKVVYSPHVYGPDVYVQPYFDYNNGFPDVLPDVWYDHWGYVRENNVLAIGEFGGKFGEGDPRDRIWQIEFVDYLIKNKICNFFYWSWNPNSGDTGGILGDDWYSIKVEKYRNLKRALDFCRVRECLLNSKFYYLPYLSRCYVY